jgi:hypothetical protein
MPEAYCTYITQIMEWNFVAASAHTTDGMKAYLKRGNNASPILNHDSRWSELFVSNSVRFNPRASSFHLAVYWSGPRASVPRRKFSLLLEKQIAVDHQHIYMCIRVRVCDVMWPLLRVSYNELAGTPMEAPLNSVHVLQSLIREGEARRSVDINTTVFPGIFKLTRFIFS